MPEELPPIPAAAPLADQTTLPTLLSGIVQDFQALVAQQIRLTRQEITVNLRLRRAPTVILTAGAGCGFLALSALMMSFAHWLHWFASPAGADPAWLPIGACYGLVSVALGAFSGVLLCVGRAQFRTIPPWQSLADEILEGK